MVFFPRGKHFSPFCVFPFQFPSIQRETRYNFWPNDENFHRFLVLFVEILWTWFFWIFFAWCIIVVSNISEEVLLGGGLRSVCSFFRNMFSGQITYNTLGVSKQNTHKKYCLKLFPPFLWEKHVFPHHAHHLLAGWAANTSKHIFWKFEDPLLKVFLRIFPFSLSLFSLNNADLQKFGNLEEIMLLHSGTKRAKMDEYFFSNIWGFDTNIVWKRGKHVETIDAKSSLTYPSTVSRSCCLPEKPGTCWFFFNCFLLTTWLLLMLITGMWYRYCKVGYKPEPRYVSNFVWHILRWLFCFCYVFSH